MSSRPPGHDRFSQMSQQADIIARKKAEIEAKIKAASEEKATPGSFSMPTNKPPPGKNSKNRWYGKKKDYTSLMNFTSKLLFLFFRGFKGKRNNSEDVETAQMAAKSDISSSPSTSHSSFKNQFSNDGSFLEQFKKFKTAKDEPKIEPKIEPKPIVPKVENKSVEDDWYKAALARAKEIAQNMSAPPPASASTTLVKSEPKTEVSSIKLDPDRSGII